VRAAIFNEPRNITAGDRPDTAIKEPSDAVVRVVLAFVCRSDLWYHRGDSPFEPGPIGHEFIGVVEDVGPDVTTLRKGDLVIAPFALGRELTLAAARLSAPRWYSA
jgi:threonine dehydrogenase-like Zn-dependent dehydrogenase